MPKILKKATNPESVNSLLYKRIKTEKIPNAKTRKAIDEAKKGKVFNAKNIAVLYEQLGI